MAVKHLTFESLPTSLWLQPSWRSEICGWCLGLPEAVSDRVKSPSLVVDETKQETLSSSISRCVLLYVISSHHEMIDTV